MNPGKLDRKIVIQKRIVGTGEAGGRSESWVDHITVRAELIRQTGKDVMAAQAERGEDAIQFRVRASRALSLSCGFQAGDHRVLYRLRFYRIESITEEGRNNTLILSCRALENLTN